ncbi:MAG TPA: signal peptidase II [Candidatus Obscuribacterales bacterium]
MSRRASPIQRAGLLVLVALITMICDQLTKRLALWHLQQGVVVKLIPYLIGMTLVTNTGTAFGLWRGVPLVGLLLPPAICLGIVYWIGRRELRGNRLTPLELVGFGLVLGGAAGNMIDRLMHGQVTDFLFFEFWTSFPVFNLADALIDVGVALIIIHSLLEKDETTHETTP